ncbi:alpha-crystallin B chain-like [Candoia aspera]|uniref:alpha-crystallin B chain-like n=1 Tax=Candoia aspera TaxID=51853 RepID=UPI002FD7DD47
MDIAIHHPWFHRTMAFPSHFLPRLFNQRLGEGLTKTDLMAATLCPYSMSFPNMQMLSVLDSGLSEMKLDKDKFSVLLDVKRISPEELNVKVVGNCTEVHAKHEEHPDEHGYISHEFHHHYMIPKRVDLVVLSSASSPDEVLSITAPNKAPALEWSIPITRQEKLAATRK